MASKSARNINTSGSSSFTTLVPKWVGQGNWTTKGDDEHKLTREHTHAHMTLVHGKTNACPQRHTETNTHRDRESLI